MLPIIQVAAAVIRRNDGSILIARRPEHLHQGGLWEFPGGKAEPGETVFSALQRELREELDIRVDAFSPRNVPLIQIHHDYGDKRVFLDVWLVQAFEGEPRGLEGQPLNWVLPEQLPSYAFPAANHPIVQAARLPERYLVTGPFGSYLDLERRLERALRNGIRLVQLRAKELSESDLLAAAELAVQVCRRFHATLLVNGSATLALRSGADGVHLSGEQMQSLHQRPLPSSMWVAASCHHREELQLAEQLNLDFVVLSPVKVTGSHPHAQPLGWPAFAELVRPARMPVYALGGLGDEDLVDARCYGAQGVAAISAWWQD